MMKHLFGRHLFFGSMIRRSEDEFIDQVDRNMSVQPTGLRWFCGMHDLDSTFICQAL